VFAFIVVVVIIIMVKDSLIPFLFYVVVIGHSQIYGESCLFVHLYDHVNNPLFVPKEYNIGAQNRGELLLKALIILYFIT